jgi:hypothetical protein
VRRLLLVEGEEAGNGLPDQGENEERAEGDAETVLAGAHPAHRPSSGIVSMYAKPTAMTTSQELKTALMA